MLNSNLLDYKQPTALDVPSAAIANAIYRAVGPRMDELPMTPASILHHMGAI